jgi:alkane 1-monooxygenase
MKLRSLKYLFAYITPAVVLFSLYMENAWSFATVVLLFGVIPFIELFTDGSAKNLSAIEEAMAKEDRVYDWLLYGLVPCQVLLLFYFLVQISDVSHSGAYTLGATLAFGMSCGVLGINAAHELGHRSTWYEQGMAKLLLLTTLYMHFFIEHNRGHHKHVSTDEDPASSKWGEPVYTFWFRSIWGSWWSAWALEAERLQRQGLRFWSIQNEMLRFQCYQILLITGIVWFFDWRTLAFYLAGASIGILLLETVNYIEHYGLRRKKVGDKYERTLPIHSWNSNHPIGRLVLLELSRHSDHHYIASRKYQTLRNFDESPQMPTGYPGMLLLTLVPPLWFWVMHPRIAAYKHTVGGEALE